MFLPRMLDHDGDSIQVLELQIRSLSDEKAEHHSTNAVRRKVVSWWTEQAQYATHVITKKASKYGGQYEQNLEFAPQRNSNGGIVIVRCDGEVGHKITKQRFETTGSGFEGRRVKNVALHDLATQHTTYYLLLQFYPRENTSLLMNLLLMQMAKTRGEIFIAVFDTCAINYSASLWLLGPHVVDELGWFRAVVFLFYLPRHGKGAVDKIFGGHRALHAASDMLTEDHLASVYEERENEEVILREAQSFVDYKAYLAKRSNGLDGRDLKLCENPYCESSGERGVDDGEMRPSGSRCLRPFVSAPSH